MRAEECPVASRYTLAFVRGNLPVHASSILEVGCGRGELAALLAGNGHNILAIDSDPEAVAATSGRGVESLRADWPANLGRGFDAILFTRSLHHIHPLAESVSAACEALRPDGRLIVEDFRSEGTGSSSRAWYEGLVRLLHSGGSFIDGFDADATIGAVGGADHDLSDSVEIEAALRDCFAVVEAEDSAYYFRYLEPFFVAADAAEAMLSHELSMIAAGSLEPLGRRFVASVPLDRNG